MSTLAALLISIPIVPVAALLFEGIDRKIHAKMQRRIGPPILQPIYDFIKLSLKETIIPETAASSRIFRVVPIISASTSMLAAAIILGSLIEEASIGGDLIVVFYLLALSSIMIMIGGSSSGNPYGAISFSRKMTMLIAYEVPILISVLSVAIRCRSLAYYDIISLQRSSGSFLPIFNSLGMFLAGATFLLCIPAAADAVPFDIPEAKTEIVHGALIEYGGPGLALLKLAKSTQNFTLTLLASTVFFYTPSILEENLILKLGTIVACLLPSLLIWLLTITLPRTIFARLKIGQALKFYWSFPLPLSVLSVLLSLIRI
ncbi:MAG: complex I subunit 1 family protein [Nitrososphaerota archaeon]|nr:NADH-quinone oxidoreductase subunit H [Candidatus Bathyarchaeota archaeon]MDW8048197.1 complex I subunit 1 family protein [Nitrososphaerota archaeon]